MDLEYQKIALHMTKNHSILLATLSALSILTGCSRESREPRAEHVIILGFDAMSARGLQRAETPTFNYMIDGGAVSLRTRCVRSTSSSQNWMSMVSAAPIEQHTVYTNNWKRGEATVPPTIENEEGLFPTIFEVIREQKPDLKQYAYVEWTGEVRMYDTTAFDRCRVKGIDPDLQSWEDVMDRAFEEYLQDRPEMMFLSIDITDHMGHTYGHESDRYLQTITECDERVGKFLSELEARGWMKNTVIIVTADHGGLSFGHGGDSLAEYEIPVILYGEGVTKGKIMHHAGMIYDVGATAAALLGVELPFECHGKLFSEAFKPREQGDIYIPIPMVRPFEGRVEGDVSISVDAPETEIYYTLDGSEPTEQSTRYEGPFEVSSAVELRSVGYRHGVRGPETVSYLSNKPSGEAPVAYKLYKPYNGAALPDFTKFGLPTATGYVDDFSLAEFPDLATADHFAILFTSNFNAPEDATYSFEVRSDDGAILYIDGESVVVNPDAHDINPAYGHIELTKGRHIIKVEYYEHSRTQNLIVKYRKGKGPWTPFYGNDLER